MGTRRGARRDLASGSGAKVNKDPLSLLRLGLPAIPKDLREAQVPAGGALAAGVCWAAKGHPGVLSCDTKRLLYFVGCCVRFPVCESDLASEFRII